MEKILFLAHTEADGSLGKAALGALGAAVKLTAELDGASLAVGFFGGDVQGAADAIATCGADAFFGVSGEEVAVSRYATDAAAAGALVKAADATVVVAPITTRTSRALPGTAQRLGGRIDTGVTGLVCEGGLHIQRWYYRQRMVATMTREQRPWILLVDAGAFETWQGDAGTASVESVSVDLPACRTQVLGVETGTSGTQTIRPDAELLFVAGAGWTKAQSDGQTHLEEAEALILGFLDKTQASLGSSKSLVDQNSEGQAVLAFMSHLNQVGQTGATPRHPKGLSTCCHGEEPHVVGWRFVGERRAVNLDANCGWARGKADVLYVADAFAVMTRVNELFGGA